MKRYIASLLIYFLMFSLLFASDISPRQPSKKDKCPVCGMFVYKYPDWVAEIIFDDSSVFFFDGAKDLFKFYHNLKKYTPTKTTKNISAIYVTEYYNMKLINAYDAFFVIGSDIYGPMGRELIPLENESDAKLFMQDHRGTRILKFKEVKRSVIEKLD